MLIISYSVEPNPKLSAYSVMCLPTCLSTLSIILVCPGSFEFQIASINAWSFATGSVDANLTIIIYLDNTYHLLFLLKPFA